MDTLTEGYGLIEGPVWVPNKGLLFSDVLGGGVFCLDESGLVEEVILHRRGIGGMALHQDNGLIVSGRNIAYKDFEGGETLVLFDRNEDEGLVGFNDITTDKAGRIYAGGLGSSPVFEDGRSPQSENLYLIDLDGSVSIVAEDVRLTNGLGFSPNDKILYHSDSLRRQVCVYEVKEDGKLGPKKVFAETKTGVPDGLVVSEDGAVWVALAGGGSGVAVYESTGGLREVIHIPHPMCTSVCFGGEDLKDLYIVSGSDGLEGDSRGGVFKVRTTISGLPVPAAKVELPPAL